MGIFVKADCIVLNGSPELLYKTGELKDQKASLNFIKTTAIPAEQFFRVSKIFLS